jgi:hypothetical protein
LAHMSATRGEGGLAKAKSVGVGAGEHFATGPFEVESLVGLDGSRERTAVAGRVLTKIGVGSLETRLCGGSPDPDTGLFAMWGGKDSHLVLVMAPPAAFDNLALTGEGHQSGLSDVGCSYDGARYDKGFGAAYDKSGRYGPYNSEKAMDEIPGCVFAWGLEHGAKVDGLTMWREYPADGAPSRLRVAVAQSDVHTVEVWDCGAFTADELGGPEAIQQLSWAPRPADWKSGEAMDALQAFRASPDYEPPNMIKRIGTPYRGSMGYGVSAADNETMLGNPYDVQYARCDAALSEPCLFVLHLHGDYSNKSIRAFSAATFEPLFDVDFGDTLGHCMMLAVRNSAVSAFGNVAAAGGMAGPGAPDFGALERYKKTSPIFPGKQAEEKTQEVVVSTAPSNTCAECGIVAGHGARCSRRGLPDVVATATEAISSEPKVQSAVVSDQPPFGIAVRNSCGAIWNVLLLHFGEGELCYAFEQSFGLDRQAGRMSTGAFDGAGRFVAGGSGPPATTPTYGSRPEDDLIAVVDTAGSEIGFLPPADKLDDIVGAGNVVYRRLGHGCGGVVLDTLRQRMITVHGGVVQVLGTPHFGDIGAPSPPPPPPKRCWGCQEDKSPELFSTEYGRDSYCLDCVSSGKAGPRPPMPPCVG